jgi:hypothetical protein
VPRIAGHLPFIPSPERCLMRTIPAVVNGTKAAWNEPSAFPPSRSLRLWIERSFPVSLYGEIAQVIAANPRGGELPRLSETRAFVLEPKGYRKFRPSWAPAPEELEFGDTFALGQVPLSADGRHAPERTKGPLSVVRCEETERWLGAALEEDHVAWSLNLRLLFKRHCAEVGADAIWELPS